MFVAKKAILTLVRNDWLLASPTWKVWHVCKRGSSNTILEETVKDLITFAGMRYLFLDDQDHGKGKQLPKRGFLYPKYVVSLQTSGIKMKQTHFQILS